MKALQLWSNDRTEQAIWRYGNRFIISHSRDQYEMMTYTQLLLREQDDNDELVEGIKLMLRVNGKKLK